MVFQPHRYTRTKDLFDEFVEVLKNVDDLLLLNIYSAGEEPIEDIDSLHIKEALERSDFSDVELIEDTKHVFERINSFSDIDTVFVLQGAGDISSISKQIEKEL
jgi:UDP-N-acetylmuramate--alanine ligase